MSENTIVKHMKCVYARRGLLVIDRIGVGVGVIMYNPAERAAVGLHVLSPKANRLAPPNPARFADTAISHAIYQFEKNGNTLPTSVAIAGGAEAVNAPEGYEFGRHIVNAVKMALEKVKLAVKLEETGGYKMRSMVLNIDAGKIKIN